MDNSGWEVSATFVNAVGQVTTDLFGNYESQPDAEAAREQCEVDLAEQGLTVISVAVKEL